MRFLWAQPHYQWPQHSESPTGQLGAWALGHWGMHEVAALTGEEGHMSHLLQTDTPGPLKPRALGLPPPRGN